MIRAEARNSTGAPIPSDMRGFPLDRARGVFEVLGSKVRPRAGIALGDLMYGRRARPPAPRIGRFEIEDMRLVRANHCVPRHGPAAFAVRHGIAAMLLALGASTFEVGAQAPASASDAGAPVAAGDAAAAAAPLSAKVIDVDGKVQWRPGPEAAWQPANVNDEIPAGSEVRTGLRSHAALRIGANATALIDAGTVFQLPTVVREGDVLRTTVAVKSGRADFKVDKVGIVHASIGRVSFAPEKIAENSQELLNAIIKAKPSSSKGTYLKGISMASTMSPGIAIDTKAFIN